MIAMLYHQIPDFKVRWNPFASFLNKTLKLRNENHLKLYCVRSILVMAYDEISNFTVSKTFLVIFSFIVAFFGTVVVEHIFTHVFNLSKDYLPESVYNQGENRQLCFGYYEVWNLMVQHGNHKTYSALSRLVVCIYVQSLKRFHLEIIKI